MSNPTRIGVSLGLTLNLGNFESFRIDYSEERDVPEGANLDAARNDLYESVESFVDAKVKEAREES